MTENLLLTSFALRGSELPIDAEAIGYRAHERISHPFDLRVEIALVGDVLDPSACLRSAMALSIVEDGLVRRVYHGVCEELCFLRAQGSRNIFEVRIVPSLFALSHRRDCRIFQDVTVVDVVEKILEEAGLRDNVRWDKTGTFPRRDFLVQYRETTLDFLTRILEDHGLFYFFEHAETGHSLIIADHAEAFVATGTPVVLTLSSGGLAGASALRSLTRTRSLRTAVVELRDFDFEKPGAPPSSTVQAKDSWPHLHYDYPGGFTKPDVAEAFADTRLRQLRHDADIIAGESTHAGLQLGVPFTVEGQLEQELNAEVVCVELTSEGRQAPGEASEPFACRNTFRAVPAKVSWKPARHAPRPRIAGIHTAIVTGDSKQDQAVHVDNYGRVKVRFYWDRVGQQDGNSSCWLRVSQLAMGGSMILPRVGWEVSVAFLEGDPDRPIVLGKLYNAEHVPPQGLPAANASGSFKSMSSPGGAGHNSIGASDTGGSQGFSMHAQKDLNMVTGGDWTEDIGVDDAQNITKNVSSSVGGTETLNVGGNQDVNVGADITSNIKAAQSTTVGGADDSNSTADLVEKIGGARSYTVSGMATTICNSDHKKVVGDFSRTVGSVHIVASVASITDNLVGSRTSTVGAVRAQLSVGASSETVGAGKSQTSLAAEVHVNRGANSTKATGAVTSMVGAIHYQKITGAFTVEAPMITLLGAVADISGGGSSVKLGGGPIVMKGSKIALKAPLIIKLAASLKEA